jgi:hypothetical protein
MPSKLSALDGLTDGISSAVQSTVQVGAGSALHAAHEGVTAHLTSAAIDGSFAPLAAAAILLAAGGVHILRTRAVLSLGALPV